MPRIGLENTSRAGHLYILPNIDIAKFCEENESSMAANHNVWNHMQATIRLTKVLVLDIQV